MKLNSGILGVDEKARVNVSTRYRNSVLAERQAQFTTADGCECRLAMRFQRQTRAPMKLAACTPTRTKKATQGGKAHSKMHARYSLEVTLFTSI